MARCRGPVNRLIMLRKRNGFGPLFQNIGGGVCAKGMGNYYGIGSPGDSVRPIAGWTGLEDCAVAAQVNLTQLRDYMNSQGWSAAASANAVIVEGQEILINYLMACDFTGITPGALRHDLCAGMQAQGYCSPGGCM